MHFSAREPREPREPRESRESRERDGGGTETAAVEREAEGEGGGARKERRKKGNAETGWVGFLCLAEVVLSADGDGNQGSQGNPGRTKGAKGEVREPKAHDCCLAFLAAGCPSIARTLRWATSHKSGRLGRQDACNCLFWL